LPTITYATKRARTAFPGATSMAAVPLLTGIVSDFCSATLPRLLLGFILRSKKNAVERLPHCAEE
jgi:hypothetical protein